MASLDELPRDVLPIPDRKPVSLTTYDAKDPDTKFPPIRPQRSVRVRAGERVAVSFILRVALLEETIVAAGKAGGRDVQEIPIALTAVSQADLGRFGTHAIEGAPAPRPTHDPWDRYRR